tara:strand:- start:7391 stop:8344 length:954 start_codon:yes stop_codon:yes gene_type:complete
MNNNKKKSYFKNSFKKIHFILFFTFFSFSLHIALLFHLNYIDDYINKSIPNVTNIFDNAIDTLNSKLNEKIYNEKKNMNKDAKKFLIHEIKPFVDNKLSSSEKKFLDVINNKTDYFISEFTNILDISHEIKPFINNKLSLSEKKLHDIINNKTDYFISKLTNILDKAHEIKPFINNKLSSSEKKILDIINNKTNSFIPAFIGTLDKIDEMGSTIFTFLNSTTKQVNFFRDKVNRFDNIISDLYFNNFKNYNITYNDVLQLQENIIVTRNTVNLIYLRINEINKKIDNLRMSNTTRIEKNDIVNSDEIISDTAFNPNL